MKQYKAIIIDDERLAREELKILLKDINDIEIVGEADNIEKSITEIQNKNPDIIFLDIQLGKETGFELLEKISGNFKTIFVTAYNDYAIKAFEVNALDYLLKPVNPDRLNLTLDRIRNNISDSPKNLDYDDSIYVKSNLTSMFVRINTVTCICAEGDYTSIFTNYGKRHVVLETIKNWEKRLPEKHFYKVHRSTIVNQNYIEKIVNLENKTSRVYLNHREEPIEMSRRFAAKLQSELK
jgi:two-component system, LytTR family, response regulator